MAKYEADIKREWGLTDSVLNDWIYDQQGDTDIKAKFSKLKQIKASVFPEDDTEPDMEHLECEDAPTIGDGGRRIDENTLIFLYRKQHAKLRFELFKLRVRTVERLNEMPKKGSIEDQKLKEELTATLDKKSEYLKQAWEMYGVVKNGKDGRDLASIMTELYTDF